MKKYNKRTIPAAFLKKAMVSLICINLFFAIPQSVSAVSVSAVSAVTIEVKSGDIIFEKNAHKRKGMASTTKIMTAICAIENMPVETVITVSPDAVGVEGSSVYLKAGEKMSLLELLYALMLQSANDAAAAIAIAVSGSIEGFADLMNAKALELGLRDTHFENPHGLDGKQHYTTAYELAKISAYALQNETFAEIVSTVTHTIPASELSPARTLVNHNRLLRMYDDVIGVKTGFTKKCGRTLVSAASREDIMLVCVTLDDGNDWQDHRAMLDHGFAMYQGEEICAEGEFSFLLPVVGGVSDSVCASNRTGLFLSLPKDHSEIITKVELPRFIYAGQGKERPIGIVRFFCDGKEIGSVDIYLNENTDKKTGRAGIFRK